MEQGGWSFNKIVHINTNDARGGAARFLWRLHSAQRLRGMESNVVVGFKESDSCEVTTFPIKFDLKTHKACSEKSLLDYSIYGSHNLVQNPLITNSDIIHFHNLHGGYFNPFSLSGLSCIKPSVWTLHDMYPITGHCIFSFDCDRWETGCINCPSLESYYSINNDSSSVLLKYKKMIYDNSVLNIVTPTRWMENKVNRSILKDHRVQTIYHGIDTELYSPCDKTAMRLKYGIPNNKIIIGMSANGGAFGDARKGGYYIKKCLDSLDKKGIDYAFVNIGAEVLKENNPRIINAGYIADEKTMAELYSTLDVFLFPSLSETFGLVIVEALSCGVPVIAFDTGAIGEIVVDDYNGRLVDYKNTQKLIEAVLELVLNEQQRKRYAYNSRISVCEKFGFDRLVKEYLALYEDCIEVFHNYDKKNKVFDINNVPEEIKNTHFLGMESIKADFNSYKATEKKPLHILVIYNSGGTDLKDSPTYNSILNQTYKNTSIIFSSIEDIEPDRIDGDLVYYVENEYIVEPDYFAEIINQYANEDAVCCMIELYRDNGNPFYKAVLPDVYEKNGIYRLNSLKHNSIIFSKDFFVKNLVNIQNAKYLEINSIDLLNFKLVKAKVSRYIEDIIRQCNNRVFIYGAGGHTSDILKIMDPVKMNICGIIDKNPDLENLVFNGIPVYNIKDLNQLAADYIIISSASFESDIFEALKSQFNEEKIIRVYGGL